MGAFALTHLCELCENKCYYRAEGRQASWWSQLIPIFSLFRYAVQWDWTVCCVLTTDDRSVDLDICQEKRRVVGIVINKFSKEQPQADSRHDRHTRSGFFISKGIRFALQSGQ